MTKNYIRVPIKTIWNGQAAIRDKYVAQAKKEGKGLLFTHKPDEAMTIENAEIDSKIVAISDLPYVDYFSNEKHHLVYFKWKADDNKQVKLF